MDLLRDQLADPGCRTGDIDCIEDLDKKSRNDKFLSFLYAQTTTLQVKQLLWIDRTDSGTMRAFDVIGKDLEPGDRISLGLLTEQEVFIGLKSTGLLRDLIYQYIALIDRLSLVLERYSKNDIGASIGSFMRLGGVVRVLLATGPQHKPLHPAVGARTSHDGLKIALDLLGT